MLFLGVNIDHVATLRQARGVDYPDPLEAAHLCRRAGAHGLTVHLREDRRHIQERDVRAVRTMRPFPLNLEMANDPEILRIALDIRPDEICFVPERREERTTEGGLDAAGQEAALRPSIQALRSAGIAVSLFIEPGRHQLDAAVRLGAPIVELHTGRFCELRGEEAETERLRLVRAAREAHTLGLQVNAGHGIHPGNLPGILTLPHLHTLNIGHSLIARAVFIGLEAAVREMLDGMAAYRGGAA